MRFSRPVPGTDRSVTVNAPSREALLGDLEARLARGEGFAVATLNLDHVVKLGRNPAFREAYLAQTHVTADGNPIVWLSWLAGEAVDLVPGSDLVDPVAAIAARQGVKVAMVGATEAALEIAAAKLAQRHPGFEVVLTLAPPMDFDPEGHTVDSVIAAIGESGAGFCYVALGAPKQEIFARRARQVLPGVGFISVGAGLDFVAGTQRRAPWIARAMAVEWLWRLVRDPSRFTGRYAACVAILPSLTCSALAARRGRGGVAG